MNGYLSVVDNDGIRRCLPSMGPYKVKCMFKELKYPIKSIASFDKNYKYGHGIRF